MKYIITAKDVYDGSSTNDIMNPLKMTEIATELVITRLYLIMLLQKGVITKSDCVVTIGERKCLYSNIFDNVINFKDFNYDEGETIDLLDNNIFNAMSTGSIESRVIPYKPFYQNWERDKEIIRNVDWGDMLDYDLSEPFICLVIRKRGAWLEKNMSDEFWDSLINKLKDNNIKTFIFGKESDKWCDNKNINYIKNYQDWCTIVKNENCKHIMSTMTGGVYPALIFGHNNINMTIIDNTNLMSKHGGDPSFYDECINFSKVKIEFINYIPETNEIYGRITNNL